jgi:pyrroloquinoline quinone biosynthesis protein B
MVSCLGIRGQTGWWLLDATPDFTAQVHAMATKVAEAGSPRPSSAATQSGFDLPDGIFLTHAHIGHYTGLMYLGREALGGHRVPVWCGERLAEFMCNNGPWDQLIQLEQVHLNALHPNKPVELEPGLTLTAIPVPHRDEYSNTFGFHIQHQSGGALLFIPDIDQWHKWDRDLAEFLQPGTTLLIDGTFYSSSELPHRNLDEIPHPLVSQTMNQLERLAKIQSSTAWPFKIGFIHLNHSNPLWDCNSNEYLDLHRRGFFVADHGMRFPLTGLP